MSSSSQTRPLEAVFILSSVSVVLSILLVATPLPLRLVTLAYHLAVLLAHLRGIYCNSIRLADDERERQSPFVIAITYVYGVFSNIWRSVVRLDDDKTDDKEEEGESSPPPPRPHAAATLASLAIVHLLAVGWLVMLGLKSWKPIVHYWSWLTVDDVVPLCWILMEIILLVAIARICTRMRRKVFQPAV